MMSARFHGLLHPLLLSLMKWQYKHQLHVMNSRPDIDGNAIYAINHSCKFDMVYASGVIAVHSYVLAGRQRMRLVDRLVFFLNGVIYVDRKSKDDKTLAKEKMKRILTEGQNLCMFPEGTWNLTPSKPMLPLYWGVIDIARETKRPIIPLVLEFKEKACYVKWGRSLYVAPGDDKQDKIEELTEIMATLKWDIWEQLPISHRETVDVYEWEREKQRRLAEYPQLDYEYEKSVILEKNDIYGVEK